MTEPSEIIQGNSYEWERNLPEYPASAWTLKYTISNADSAVTFTASPSGDAFAMSLSTADTSALSPGRYTLSAYVEQTGKRVLVDQRDLEVKPDLSAAADRRSYAQRALEAIEATILGAASNSQQQVEIDGRSISRYTPEQLIVLRDRLKREVEAEKAAARASRGGYIPGRVLVRFR
jgi:hypothetical protein